MIPTLQSLRFIFVMMIFMSHFAYDGIGAFDAGGDGGVAFFFVLSGFVLSLGYGQRISQATFSFRSFMCRRLLKIYPLHLLCLVAVLMISRPLIDLRVVLNVLLLQCWVPLKDYYFSCNSVSWFLSCMLFCYLAFPWLYRHASRRLTLVAVIACTVVYLVVPYNLINNILYVNPLVRCFDFYMGIVLGRYYANHRSFVPPVWFELLLVVMLTLALVAYPYVDEKLRNAPLFWLVLLPFIPVFASARGPVACLMKTRPMQWLGSLSMPLFLIHPLAIAVLMHLLPSLSYGAMLALCLTFVILLSWLTDRLFLQPIHRMLLK